MKVDRYPVATPERAARRKELTPEINELFLHFSRAVCAEGASPEKTMQLIAVAVAHVTQHSTVALHAMVTKTAERT